MVDEPVELAPYDRDWPRFFQEERNALSARLNRSDLRFEHFGSTAVEGMTAKPIVDILIGVPRPLDIEPLVGPLQGLGYEFLGEAGVPGRWAFRHRGVRRFNLAVVEADSALWRHNLAIRDYLRTHEEARAAYIQKKRTALHLGLDTLLAYSGHKAGFLRSLEKQALGDLSPPSPSFWGG